MRSRPLPTQRRFAPSQSFPSERSHTVRPTGIVLAILSTFIAVPILMSGSADGSQDHLAASISLPDTSTSTSAPESTSSSLFEHSEGTSMFLAGAQVAVPLGETSGDEAPDPLGPEVGVTGPSTTVAGSGLTTTSAAPSTTAPATTAVPTTKAPTTAAPTTKRATTTQPPTTQPATTQPATTQPATTAAPATTAPAPTDAPATTTPSTNPTAEQWAQLRHCESSGNYAINTGNGYYGAYQFNLTTWDGVARGAGRGDLVGVKPSNASPADQDALALALWTARGPGPWPHCGRFLPPRP